MRLRETPLGGGRGWGILLLQVLPLVAQGWSLS